MKKLILIALGLALLSGCPGEPTANNSAVNTVNKMANNSANAPANNVAAKTDDLKAYSDSSMSADDRIKAIDEYVKGIESKLPKDGSEGTAGNLKRKESDISKNSFEDVTQEKWAKMHTYYAGETLKRLKVYSPEGEKKTEEFYFFNDKPVYVFIENDGMGKKADTAEAKGDKFYFGSEGLFAWIKADGSKGDTSSKEFKNYKENLPEEANAFLSVEE